MTVTIYLDMASGYAWSHVQPLPGMLGSVPAKSAGVRRYKIVVEVDDPAEPDSVQAAHAALEDESPASPGGTR